MDLLEIPPSAFLFHLCPFLSPSDLLALRRTSRQCHNLLHQESGSEALWKILLQRDFALEASRGNETNTRATTGDGTEDDTTWNRVLSLAFPNPSVTSIFGIDPTREDFLLTVVPPGDGRGSESGIRVATKTVAFEVWRYWLKTSGRVFQGNTKELWSGRGESPILVAPYFLRAASLWRSMMRWCDGSGAAGGRIRRSLQTGHQDSLPRMPLALLGSSPPAASRIRVRPPSNNTYDDNNEFLCRMAILAVYSFTSGQGSHFSPDKAFDGMFGGCHAYGYYSCTSLVPPLRMVLNQQGSASPWHVWIVANDWLSAEQGVVKRVMMDARTGGLYLFTQSPELQPLLNESGGSLRPPRPDDLITWMEEYVRRLTQGVYRVDVMGTHPNEPRGISVYPNFPTMTPLPITDPNTPALVSRAVTRGIEVVASAVYAPQGRDRFGYMYCIRLRLLPPGEECYQSEEERGFASCQLATRHWNIHDDANSHTDVVEGQGVIGMYPLLTEGGYSVNGRSHSVVDGVFQYQSCTGHMEDGGSFGGHIVFVPGSVDQPTGPSFRVLLHPFRLQPRPSCLY